MELLQTEFVGEAVVEAAEAIIHLWDDLRGTFWRSTEHRAREESVETLVEFFPTVTFRCIQALIELTESGSGWIRQDLKEFIVNKAVPSLLARNPGEFRSSLTPEEGERLNPFTLSLYVQTLALIGKCDHMTPELRAQAIVCLKEVLEVVGIFSDDDGFEVHPFILYHTARAIRLCIQFSELAAADLLGSRLVSITKEARAVADKLLARIKLNILNPSEAVALAFCAATLSLSDHHEDRRYVIPSLSASIEAQDASGCWPLGRVVRHNKDIAGGRLEISTYEIAWGIAESLLALARTWNGAISENAERFVLAGLVKAGKYAHASIIQIGGDRKPIRGWCSDPLYGTPIIESWTSATVLQSLLRLHDAAEDTNHRIVLGSFRFVDPRGKEWPSWIRWEAYKLDNEPDTDTPILSYIDQRLVQPILASPSLLPSPENRTVSALLFGPPGTAKTTLVYAVAESLGWPVVTLSPGNFIERGLEYIEAESRFVFDRLSRLKRCIVIFDECDELFRDRRPLQQSEQMRTITAFVTASMLPKLQDLHDRGRVLFFICTNHFESLDPAVKRGGRIDHIVAVGPPGREARRRIIQYVIKEYSHGQFWQDCVEELAAETERFTRSELLRVAKLVRGPWNSPLDARGAARRAAARLKDSLNISAEEMAAFNEQKERYSHPVLEAEGA